MPSKDKLQKYTASVSSNSLNDFIISDDNFSENSKSSSFIIYKN